MSNNQRNKIISTINLEDGDELRPSPDNFDQYLPWACTQLQVEVKVIVTRIVQHGYVSVSTSERSKSKNKTKSRPNQSKLDVVSDQYIGKDKTDNILEATDADDVLRIFAVYDNTEKLVEIKFDINKKIPRVIFKIIGLILKYQIHLSTIAVNKGLDHYGVYEISQFIPFSHITDICLDNTVLKYPNYHELLQNGLIKKLSLSRCSIDDFIIEAIAEKIIYPLPASKTLSILNLSSNKITDMGAKHLAETLRSNRCLCYLNLAGNMLTDDGAETLLNSLKEFPLCSEELLESKKRLIFFLKTKNDYINRMTKELKESDLVKQSINKPIIPESTTSGQKTKGLDVSLKSKLEPNCLENTDAIYNEKASLMADNILGEFNDPFHKKNTFIRDGITYCYGNNTMRYLNLAYNNLTYITVNSILNVLLLQKSHDRNPRGLINISIDGNNMPVSCKELWEIGDILQMGLMANDTRQPIVKKRPLSKTIPR